MSNTFQRRGPGLGGTAHRLWVPELSHWRQLPRAGLELLPVC